MCSIKCSLFAENKMEHAFIIIIRMHVYIHNLVLKKVHIKSVFVLMHCIFEFIIVAVVCSVSFLLLQCVLSRMVYNVPERKEACMFKRQIYVFDVSGIILYSHAKESCVCKYYKKTETCSEMRLSLRASFIFSELCLFLLYSCFVSSKIYGVLEIVMI